MNVLVATEYRFTRCPSGAIVSEDGTRGYAFWCRYLAAFESVVILGRVQGPRVCTGQAVEGTGVRVSPLPPYLGVTGFLKNSFRIRHQIRGLDWHRSAVIARVPGACGSLVLDVMQGSRHPYALEVVGDPRDVFAPGAVHHPLRIAIRAWSSNQLRRLCRTGAAASYVTSGTLQRRYPCLGHTTGISDVDLTPDWFLDSPRTDGFRASVPKALFVGSLEQPYKGVDLLLKALAICLARGVTLNLTVVGEGRCRGQLEELARDLAVAPHVHFRGRLTTGQAVRDEMDSADLFVLPSRCEGLPRALLEAMARGLPCVASRVGGVPELLPEADLIQVGSKEALANKLLEVLQDPTRLVRMSAENLLKAGQYRASLLGEKRTAFYREVRCLTEKFLDKTAA